MQLIITDRIVEQVASTIEWYRNEVNDRNSNVLRPPEKDGWKKWNNNRLWCSVFFSIISPGGSRNAREYLKLVENQNIGFELHPDGLVNLGNEERTFAIWKFGTGGNHLNKRLARFFSKPENIGRPSSLEFKLNDAFHSLHEKGFIEWLRKIDKLGDERSKAKEIECLPGSKLKVSRDFLNNIGMTHSLIPLDIHILSEMKTKWKWDVPQSTPSNRETYEKIEDAVRKIAKSINRKVVEIDKAIVSARLLRVKV